ncbi:hypothetical protein ACFYQ5_04315 [Streptomyces sp. NPDC005794]|uniref:hypothetical protein n=1 Tax=Streptomyces sp. NPDC005794 TaxID=3364733 RepID=UPI0036C9877E
MPGVAAHADHLRRIRESSEIMAAKGVPGTYEDLRRTLMRESGGDLDTTNGWDANAQNGTPSEGLLQVIQPAFGACHVAGTPRGVRRGTAPVTVTVSVTWPQVPIVQP